ncbi:META domain-containing protein [Mycobacterium sp. AMU20-3851]|uniref:META domain-containing protein n=1 Tax=Mycobacterium sp. AMU20-3851 TaxID=3122055 RepID=UPI00375486B9
MRLLLLLLTLTGLVAVGCAGTTGAQDPTPEGREFVSVNVTGEPIPGGGPMTLGFADGQISAFAGCNRGSAAVDLTDGRLSAGELAMTMMGCPPPRDQADGWLSRFLAAGPAWTLTGDDLTLSTDTTTVTLRDKKVVNPDRPLIGTTWQVDTLVSGDAATTSAALERSRPTLTRAADGSATGFTGCNQFNGPAEVSETAGQATVVNFGPLATTRRACEADLDEIEKAVLRVLDGPVQTSIDADRLTLTRADGNGLVLRAV